MLGFLADDRVSNRKEIDTALFFSNVKNERMSNCDIPVQFTGQNGDLTQ